MNMAPANIRLNPVGLTVCGAVALCIAFYTFGLPSWLKEEQRISMKELLSVSIELAKRGGEKVRVIRESAPDDAGTDKLGQVVKGKTKEGKNELYTTGDIESHRSILYGFSKAFPGLKIISEEHDTQPVDFKNILDVNKKLPEVTEIIQSDQLIPMNEITVWIDPLDATEEYKDNLKQFVTVMVCVAVKGEPTIGVIYKPFSDEMAWAWVGYGHSVNLKKASESKNEDVKARKIIVSRSHPGEVEKVVKEAFGEEAVVIPAGGAGYKTLEVVKGNADAYVHITAIKKWDICAGNAILSAVNGHMVTLESRYIDYSSSDKFKNPNGLLASLYNHDELLYKLQPVLKKKDLKKKNS